MVEDLASALARVTGAAGKDATARPFNTEIVRTAWEDRQRAARQRRRAARRAAMQAAQADGLPSDPVDVEVAEDPMEYSYVHQLWTDHIVVSSGGRGEYMSIPYTVKSPGASSSDVEFGEPTRVKEVYVAASAPGERGLAALCSAPPRADALDRIVAASAAGEGEVAMSAPPWVGKNSRPGSNTKGTSSSDSADGLKVRADPTLSGGALAIVNARGKRVGVIKKQGNKYTHSKDNHKQQFNSAEAAKRVFANKHENNDGSGSKSKADGMGKSNPFPPKGDDTKKKD